MISSKVVKNIDTCTKIQLQTQEVSQRKGKQNLKPKYTESVP